MLSPMERSDTAASTVKGILSGFASRGFELLGQTDPTLYALLEAEYRRQTSTLVMIAAASIASPAVLACEGTVLGNITTEGYPGRRYHAGCRIVDEIENLAIERAKKAFGAQYANVQPHSCTSANEIVMFSLLEPGDTILGLQLDAGGHLTHGAPASVSGQYFRAIGYGLDKHGYIDYDRVRLLARQFRPKLIVCGASAYPRFIEFQRFREIADEVGAYVLADISHIAGLVVAGAHPSPIDTAHVTTTSTYKQLFGPRGGLMLMGRDSGSLAPDGKRTLAQLMQRAVFPFFQGTPNLSAIAAKASALHRAVAPAFKQLVELIVADAKALARSLAARGFRVITGGTDTHLILIDVARRGVTGIIAERALEECNIIVNKNKIPGDNKGPTVTSGIRLGTNILAVRGLPPSEIATCAELIDRVINAIDVFDDTQFKLDPTVTVSVKAAVAELCRRYPIPEYTLERVECYAT